MPDNIHRIGHALNTVTALALTAGVLAIFSEDIKLRLDEHAALVRALAQNALRVHLQPQVSARGPLIGAEVLLRWNQPGHGLQPPAELVRLAEDTGLIQQISLWVLEQACLQLHAWGRHPGAAQLLLSVNVSPLQLVSASFVEDMRAVVHRARGRHLLVAGRFRNLLLFAVATAGAAAGRAENRPVVRAQDGCRRQPTRAGTQDHRNRGRPWHFHRGRRCGDGAAACLAGRDGMHRVIGRFPRGCRSRPSR
ncbi:EAL domain-containing protein [Xanthomonas translucens]|uniref:EAL domain-containing protein n=1 Tax=Xanthomonas campestris pv. translucens TaxID=343 RepID=UPI003CCEED2B